MVYIKNSKKIVRSIILVILLGFLLGVLKGINLPEIDYEIERKEMSFFKLMINTFSINYWYLFLIWFIGFFPCGFIILYFMDFYKGFLSGLLLGMIIKANGVFGLFEIIKYVSCNMLFIIFITLYISFFAIYNSMYSSVKNNYYSKLIIMTLFLLVCSILSSFLLKRGG